MRVLPKDTYQGAALVALAKDEGCASAYILNDKEVYGAGLAKNVELSAKDQGLEIKGDDGIDKSAANYRSLGQKVARTGAECMIYTGITANNAVQIFKDMAVALPKAPLLGPEGVGETGFFDPKEGGLPPDVAKRTRITIPGVAPEEYPPAGKQFLKDYTAKYGEKNPDRYAVYGYESMSVLLDAIKRAGGDGGDRAAVVEAAARHQGPRGRVRQVLVRLQRRHHAHARTASTRSRTGRWSSTARSTRGLTERRVSGRFLRRIPGNRPIGAIAVIQF